jgi:hypothetical protein
MTQSVMQGMPGTSKLQLDVVKNELREHTLGVQTIHHPADELQFVL